MGNVASLVFCQGDVLFVPCEQFSLQLHRCNLKQRRKPFPAAWQPKPVLCCAFHSYVIHEKVLLFLTWLSGLQLGRTRLEVNVKLKANFNAQLFAMNVVVTIPVPDNTANADLQITQGERPVRVRVS